MAHPVLDGAERVLDGFPAASRKFGPGGNALGHSLKDCLIRVTRDVAVCGSGAMAAQGACPACGTVCIAGDRTPAACLFGVKRYKPLFSGAGIAVGCGVMAETGFREASLMTCRNTPGYPGSQDLCPCRGPQHGRTTGARTPRHGEWQCHDIA